MTFSDSEEQIFNKILETVEGEMEVEYLQEPSQAILTFPGLEIRIREQEVYHNNTFVPLSHYEFSTLLYLAKHPNWVFSKEQIYIPGNSPYFHTGYPPQPMLSLPTGGASNLWQT